MLGFALAFVAGNLSVLCCPANWPQFAPVAGLVAAAALLAWPRGRALAFALAGASLAMIALVGHRAGLQREEERVIAQVRIVGLPQQTAEGLRVDAWLQVPRESARPRQFVRLAWPGEAGRRSRPGETWQLLVRLRPPEGACNPGAIDTARNALRDGVQAFASVIDSRLNRRIAAAGPSLAGLRERLATSIARAVEDPGSAALLAALAVGATQDVTPGQWRVFNATGITHLVAISGSHVTAFALVAMGLARFVCRLAARRGLRWRRERVVAVAGVVLATGYALLAGAGVPTQRTLLMLAAFLLLRECGRVTSPGTPLGIAAVLIVVIDPFSTLSAGFWLSFLAVAAILGVAGNRVLREGGLRAAVGVQAAVFVALLPVTLAIFGSVSIAGLFVNALAIPLFGLLLVPLALAATACWLFLPDLVGDPLAQLCLKVAAFASERAMTVFNSAADLPWALWFASPSGWWYGLAGVGCAAVLLPWSTRLRIAGACAVLPVVGVVDAPAADSLRVTFFDMASGSSALVEAGSLRWLYGLGEGFRSDGGQTERVILPALMQRGVGALDALVLPRFDRDAGAGVTALLARLPVAVPHAPGGDAKPPDFEDCSARSRRAGAWRLEMQELPGSGCVMRASGPGGSVWLADRLDVGGEGRLAELWREGATVLAVPRQGSPAASSAAFIRSAHPRFAVVTPRAAAAGSDALGRVRQRYAEQGVRWLDTSLHGAMTLTISPSGKIVVHSCRADRLGAWGRGRGTGSAG